MGTTPPRQSPRHPRRYRDNSDYSPTPSEMMRRFVVWLRGFHWNREKAKVTDWLVVGLTLAVAVAAVWSAWVFQGQLHEAQKSTRLSVRPWVGLDEGGAIETTPLQIDESGNVSLTYTIRAKNYSSSPATNVWAAANLVIADDLTTVYEQQGFACSDAMIGKPDIGLVLFQGKERVFNSMPAFTKITLKHGSGFQIGIWMAGCIGYRDQFGYLCRTKFIWGFRDETGRQISLQAPIPAMIINGHFVATASGGAIDTCQIPKYK